MCLLSNQIRNLQNSSHLRTEKPTPILTNSTKTMIKWKNLSTLSNQERELTEYNEVKKLILQSAT